MTDPTRLETDGTVDSLNEPRIGSPCNRSEIASSERPTLTLKVNGTGPIARIDLVKNGRYVFNSAPDDRDVEIEYVDREPRTGLNYYYFRVQQENGEVAWASPIWMNRK